MSVTFDIRILPRPKQFLNVILLRFSRSACHRHICLQLRCAMVRPGQTCSSAELPLFQICEAYATASSRKTSHSPTSMNAGATPDKSVALAGDCNSLTFPPWPGPKTWFQASPFILCVHTTPQSNCFADIELLPSSSMVMESICACPDRRKFPVPSDDARRSSRAGTARKTIHNNSRWVNS